MRRTGQSYLEYAMLIGCVTMALFAMQVYLKRGVQGVVKSTSDDLGSPVLEELGWSAQIEGSRSKGRYYEDRPTTISHAQGIVNYEYASGERGFVINQDRRVTDGAFTTWQRLRTYADPSSRSSNKNLAQGSSGVSQTPAAPSR